MSAAAFEAEYGLDGFKTSVSMCSPFAISPYTSSVLKWKKMGWDSIFSGFFLIKSKRFLTPLMFDLKKSSESIMLFPTWDSAAMFIT